MKCLKVYFDFAESTSQLNDGEMGRLVRAMLLYAKAGEEPTLTGNERFMWPYVKQIVDGQRNARDKHLEALEIANAKKKNAVANLNFADAKNDFAVAKEKGEEREIPPIPPKEKEDPKRNITPVVSNETTAPTGARVFQKPTLEEVKAYCRDRGNDIDAEAFLDFYESKGWMIGKNHMKDWKAAVRTWEKGRKEGAGGKYQPGLTERDRQREEVRRKYEGRNFFSD